MSVSVLCVALVFLFSEERKCCLWKHYKFFYLNEYLLFYFNSQLLSCSGINIREEIIHKKKIVFFNCDSVGRMSLVCLCIGHASEYTEPVF